MNNCKIMQSQQKISKIIFCGENFTWGNFSGKQFSGVQLSWGIVFPEAFRVFFSGEHFSRTAFFWTPLQPCGTNLLFLKGNLESTASRCTCLCSRLRLSHFSKISDVSVLDRGSVLYMFPSGFLFYVKN